MKALECTLEYDTLECTLEYDTLECTLEYDTLECTLEYNTLEHRYFRTVTRFHRSRVRSREYKER